MEDANVGPSKTKENYELEISQPISGTKNTKLTLWCGDRRGHHRAT